MLLLQHFTNDVLILEVPSAFSLPEARNYILRYQIVIRIAEIFPVGRADEITNRNRA